MCREKLKTLQKPYDINILSVVNSMFYGCQEKHGAANRKEDYKTCQNYQKNDLIIKEETKINKKCYGMESETKEHTKQFDIDLDVF